MSPKISVSRETNLDPHLPLPWAPRVREDIEEVPGTHLLMNWGFGAKSLCSLLLGKLNHESKFPKPFPEHLGRDRQDQVLMIAASEKEREGRKYVSSVSYIKKTTLF